jgi:uncharacterized Zn-binding protein involved in type VI secretion
MPGQGRLGDKAQVPLDAHGCPACPHPSIGPAIAGSPDVNVNKRPALRVDDPGIHMACCGANTWTATQGSLTVFINGKAAHRIGDQNRHCGGMGRLVEGSPNVIVGESSSAGGGAGGGGPRVAEGGGGGGGGGSSGGAGSHAASSGGGGSGGSGGTSRGGDTRTDDKSTGAGADEPPIEPDMIEVRLVDSSSALVQRAVAYELTFPDGSKRTGVTDGRGVLRLTALTQRGDCTLVLPDFDQARKPS